MPLANLLPKPKEPDEKSSGVINWVAILILVFGFIIVLLFGASLSGKAAILIWMLACLLTGTAIGFLFGIPKILQSTGVAATDAGAAAAPAYRQQVNTNLTEISDWLTKIIVGLGLVNLKEVPPLVSRVAKKLAVGLSASSAPSAEALAFSYGTIICYTILGFLFGYITTRLYLAGAFSRADQRAIQGFVQKAQEAAGAAQSALQKAEYALIKPAAPSQDPAMQEPEVDRLAESYNEIRNSLGSGTLRTRKMTEIFKNMTAAVPAIGNFDVVGRLKDTDNGKRLSAYAWLLTNPDPQYVNKLADAIVSDTTAFGQYWGIQALGRLIEKQPSLVNDQILVGKMKPYFDQLENGVDRKYELGRIMPNLKN
ncbi:MAG: hypothetical protein C5B59_09945 [Bacteroidetes bacterium]|nr:MAG: hypothetical protein C5B59_09945 [Bacteroidota bacterium]